MGETTAGRACNLLADATQIQPSEGISGTIIQAEGGSGREEVAQAHQELRHE